MIKKNWLPIGFIVFAASICILFFNIELLHHRFWLNDFKVYYLSAKAMLDGQQIYGIHHGLDSGFYKYSPFVLLIFIPFTFLHFKLACIIYYWAIVIAVLWIFSLVKFFMTTYFFPEKVKHLGWILSIIFIFILNLLCRELHLGNTNIFLLLLILLTIKLVNSSRFIVAGILFSLILLFKPFFLILTIPLLLHKKYRIITSATIFMMLQALLLLIVFGWSTFYFLHTEWIKTIFNHSTSFPSNNNIDYLVRHFISANIPANFEFIILIAVVLLFTILFIYKNHFMDKQREQKAGNRNFILECFILIAVIPSMLNTDTEHFLYSMPLISLITFTVFKSKKPVLFICLFLVFLFYGTNSNDIVGESIGDFYDRIGAVGISNLLLIIWGCWIYLPNKKLLLPK